jgi:hypothetical protein
MFLDTRLGKTPRWFLSHPKDWNMRIPEVFLTCTVFLGRLIEAGSRSMPKYAGTGFLVWVPSSIDGIKYLYLVTARHVADQLSLERSEKMSRRP